MIPFEEDLRFQLEESPFSEEIGVRWGGAGEAVELITLGGEIIGTLDGVALAALGGDAGPGIVLRGIFDESVDHDSGTKAPHPKLRIMVYRWFRRTPPGTRVTVRGKEYEVTSNLKDANIGIVVWLALRK